MSDINSIFSKKRYSNVTGDGDASACTTNQCRLDVAIARKSNIILNINNIQNEMTVQWNAYQDFANIGDYDNATPHKNNYNALGAQLGAFQTELGSVNTNIANLQAIVAAEVSAAQAHAIDLNNQANQTPAQRLAAQQAAAAALLAKQKLDAANALAVTVAANKSKNLRILVFVGSGVAVLLVIAYIINTVRKKKASKKAAAATA